MLLRMRPFPNKAPDCCAGPSTLCMNQTSGADQEKNFQGGARAIHCKWGGGGGGGGGGGLL